MADLINDFKELIDIDAHPNKDKDWRQVNNSFINSLYGLHEDDLIALISDIAYEYRKDKQKIEKLEGGVNFLQHQIKSLENIIGEDKEKIDKLQDEIKKLKEARGY